MEAATTIKLTREELYELVWTKPIHQLAAEFGLSDVGLAKVCKRFNIPRPSRGHWAKVAAGVKVKRVRLPDAPANARSSIVFDRPLAHAAKEAPPLVEVAARLVDPHEAVRRIQTSLADAKPDDHGRLIVGTRDYPVFCVTPSNKDRALRILDAIVKALVARGYEVVAGPRFKQSTIWELLVKTSYETLALQIDERLDRSSHTLTKDEKQKQEKWGWSNFPKYDYFPSNRLRLKMEYAFHYQGHKSWSDGRGRLLEDLLGAPVLAIEASMLLAKTSREEEQRRREQHLVDERKRLRPDRMRWYARWLVDNLDAKLAEWQRAQQIREFLVDYDRCMLSEEKTEKATRWRKAIGEFAERVDPLTRVTDIAQDMEPADEVLERLIADVEARANSQRK